ncbi:MAG: bifunctional (p)ppGpp synthetase/guanosine-3',5'-bis(diphosphate) 3'-pyrophosphohydrolase [Bacteroidales bacterium]|nr:bifunctional (p)ppGpp synthetase/guanosine-3',5'-bis(diphosphate) 3'-pyrophosphohydrolase [Bacteroidales bacterium]
MTKQDLDMIDTSLFFSLYKRIYLFLRQTMSLEEVTKLTTIIRQDDNILNSEASLNQLMFSLKTAIIAVEEIRLKQAAVCSILLFNALQMDYISLDDVEANFGNEIKVILSGLQKVHELDSKRSDNKSDNYVKLILSFIQDVRVIFIVLAMRVQQMREAKEMDNDERFDFGVETLFLYAPLAHRMGLYNIKSELEDLSLKYTDRQAYDYVARKLNETKRSRDKYIDEFIAPVRDKLEKTGLKFEIKGRTKSIFSILNKLKKQQVDFEDIYDLFAIRVVLDSDMDNEKAECWQVYSIITDMYQPNPKRLKDWLSIPKSNGYESLHITVMGPDTKWVEVQIRTRRMNEVAERGLAAHWRYKGLETESSFEEWLKTLRESLESRDTDEEIKLKDFKLNLYDDEVFVFTPKGDLKKLPKGATVLDFAYSIHTKVGSTCVSGRVNGRNVPIKYKLKSGEQVEIITSPNQSPKQDWLNFVVTSKARNKIRQTLKEETSKQIEFAKEMLLRRMKNRKIDYNESILFQVIKKLRYKTVTDFYCAIADDKLDVNNIIDKYVERERRETEVYEPLDDRGANQFKLEKPVEDKHSLDELVIDQNLRGIDYELAKCCNPIFGDKIFGYISSQGIKIHRLNCPNASDLFARYGYRVLNARWTGQGSESSSYTTNLRVIGNDHINIVASLMSIISKEEGVQLRSINIDSVDGLFQGALSVSLANTSKLESLIKKLKEVKGVKQISRIN